ncbi:MAG: hypothetical protein M1826_003139 [Phylliscum demangeonii]|nr:MAG: hypothetical protein M1826_003139 [Phylliscum demangeonii]
MPALPPLDLARPMPAADPVSPAVSADARSVNHSQVAPRPVTGMAAAAAVAAELPCFPLLMRQARSSRMPQYRPAVLRPTERPSRFLPLTPPQSSSNSLDSLQSADSPYSLSRQSTGDSTTKVGWASILDLDGSGPALGGKGTGTPTRDHWKPDADVASCEAAACDKPFGLFERRHHCRRCGNVFCNDHTPFAVPLDRHARFHPDGSVSRACHQCWSEYRGWQTQRCSRANSASSYDRADRPTTPLVGLATGADARRSGGCLPPTALKGSSLATPAIDPPAGSVPRDWAWSTF